jgi:hypothetical protein
LGSFVRIKSFAIMAVGRCAALPERIVIRGYVPVGVRPRRHGGGKRGIVAVHEHRSDRKGGDACAATGVGDAPLIKFSGLNKNQ